jgi:hypothetical protein
LFTWTSRLLTLILLMVLALLAWFAYDIFIGDRDGSLRSPSEPSYSELEIYEDAGHFGGTITLRNPLEDDIEMMVEVDIYDGGQNVGDLWGMVSMKPKSQTVLELSGYDEYVTYTDARVDLGGWRK